MATNSVNTGQTILLDFDGVIVDSLVLFVDAVNSACSALEYPAEFTSQDLCGIKYMSIAKIADAAGVDKEYSDLFIEEIDNALERNLSDLKLFPDMADVLLQLSEYGYLGIVSASPGRIISGVLENHNVRGLVKDIAGGDTQGRKNERITRISRLNNTEISSTWMIGDTLSDILEGKIAGVKTVGVGWGWHEPSLLQEEEPDFIARKPQDLVDLVRAV